jgi:hypothetical protein
MESYEFNSLTILLDKEGSSAFSKVSYPIRYGRFAEIKTPDHVFQYNLNGEIKYVQGRGRHWPHPAEWLKRTMGNDWIYYSSGDYKGVFEVMGEYYFPCLSYSSNSVFPEKPFENDPVTSATTAWESVIPELEELTPRSLPVNLRDFLTRVAQNNTANLRNRAHRLHRLLGRRVTVLPPDTRHVDYDVIPLMVADGCLYKCGFCRVKSGQDFLPRTHQDILKQVQGLKAFYGRDLKNYNSLFLGEHDALRAGQDVIAFAVEHAYRLLEFEKSYMKGPSLFLFGSADSLLDAKETLFERLSAFPLSTYINVGLESGDPTTLAALRKPISPEKVRHAFTRMLDINKTYGNIEVTANFVFGSDLPVGHLPALFELTQGRLNSLHAKGTLYLSPLIGVKSKKEGSKREILRHFKEVKVQSPLPTFLYLIQRL